MNNTTVLKPGICYAGLVDIFGGKMWYVDNNGSAEYYATKIKAEKAIRAAYKDDAPRRRAILAQLKASKGRCCFYA